MQSCVVPMERSQLEQLAVHLQSQLGRRVREIRLVLRDEGLVLQGRASSYYAKQLAQHALMRATQVPLLANEIDVSSDSSPRRAEGATSEVQEPVP